jgi:hypothetical protein
MTKQQFAEKILKCTCVHWYCVLNGTEDNKNKPQKNLGYRKAVVAAQVLGTSVDLWVNPDASVNDRQKAWNDFAKDTRQEGGNVAETI